MPVKKQTNYEPTELTQEQKDKIDKWLIEKWGPDGPCYVCKTSNWAILSHLVTPVVFSEKGFWAGGPAYPQAAIVCTNCGHTVYFNAILIGLVEEEEQGSKEKPGDGNG